VRRADGAPLRLALLLLGGLLLVVALTVVLLAGREPARAAVVPLRFLGPQGVAVLELPGPSAAVAYERMLLQAEGGGWLDRLWRPLRRHAPLRDAQLLAEARDLAAAGRRLEARLRDDPGDLPVAWRRLELLAARGDQAALVEAAGALLARAPGFGPALLRRARARELTGERLGALVDLSAALERPLAPSDFAEAASALLQLLVDLGHPSEARALAVRLGGDLPRSTGNAAALGHAAHALGDHEAAVAQFRLALETEATPALLLALARSLGALGQDRPALDLLLGERFEGAAEGERRRLLSRLAGRLRLADLAILSAEQSLALSEDPLLRLELAQRLLDDRGEERGAAERALLVLSHGAAHPCAAQPAPALRRCRRLAAEALRRSGRHGEAAELLRAAFAGSEDAALLGEFAITLLALQRPLEAGHLLAGLATARQDPEGLGRAAEAYLEAGRPGLGLALLDSLPAERPARAHALELVAAERAGDWPRLLRLLRARPRGADGLPRADPEARAYCRALGASRAAGQRGCIEALARRHPAEAELQYYAADLARRDGDGAAAVAWLERAVVLRGEGLWLLELGYLLHGEGRSEAAERRLREAEQAGAGAAATLALAYALLRRGRKGPAAHLLRRALARPGLAEPERVTALAALATVLEEVQAFEPAAEVYAEALALGEDPLLRLGLARASFGAGWPLRAERLLLPLDGESLPPPERARLLDLRAELARARDDGTAEVEARRQAAALAPTAARYELLASAQLRWGGAGDRGAARASLAQSLALGADSPRLLARLAHLHRAAGDRERAEGLFREAALRDPETPEYREELALLLAERGERDEALSQLRSALDEAASHPAAAEAERRERVARLRALHAGLSRRWRLRWEETLCLGGEGDCRRTSVLARESRVGQGLAEAAFRPLASWPRLELTARLNWDRAARRLAPSRRFLQGALGLRVQPYDDRDLWISLERLQALGEGGRDDWRLAVAYRAAYGLEWTAGDSGPAPFASFYGEFARHAGGERETSLTAEVMAGLRAQHGERFAWLPFLYLAGGRESARDLALVRLEAGLGLAGHWRVGEHPYDGHLAELGLSLRVGQERDSLGARATRGQLGLALRY